MAVDFKTGQRARALGSAIRDVRINADVVATGGIFLLSFFLYARTVAPGVLDDDGAEFQTNMYRLGVSHTGYPLYFLLGKLWMILLPIGGMAYRANLLSSLFGALAASLVYVTMRTLVRSRTAALITAGLFALSRIEWSQSVIPRVYTLNSFFVVLIILFAILWRTRRIPLEWLVFAFGLSLTNHRTMMWFAPALFLFAVLGEGRSLFRPKRLVRLTFAFVLPLLFYLYVPWRGDSDVGVEYHVSQFSDMILAGNASISWRFGPPGFLWDRFSAFYLPLQIEQFTLIGFAFGLLGLGSLALNRPPQGFPKALPPRQFLTFLGMAFLWETAFGIVFWTFDSEKYFLPSYIIFLFLIGIGLALAFDWAGKRRPGFVFTPAVLRTFLAATIIGVCLFLFWGNYSKVDASWDDRVEGRWQEILSQPLDAGSLLVGNWESLAPLEYYQYVEQARTDLRRLKVVINKDQLKLAPQGDIGEIIERNLDAGQSVYMTIHPSQTETLRDLEQRFDFIPVATLWRAQKKGTGGSQASDYKLDAQVGPALLLESATFLPRQPHAGDMVDLRMSWLKNGYLSHNYKFSLRLLDTVGNIWLQHDLDPFGGTSPTSEWPTNGQTVEDEGFFIPPDAPPGNYTVELAAYDSDSGITIPISGSQVVQLGVLTVTTSQHSFPSAVYNIPHLVGKTHLLGYGLSDSKPSAGDSIELATWWLGLTEASSDLQVQLIDARGTRTTVYESALFPAVQQMNSNQVLRARQTLELPPNASAGAATLNLSLGAETWQITGLDLRASDRQFTEPRISHTQLASLGRSIQFLGYDLDGTSLRTGDQLRLSLYWHAKDRPSNSYKVFVHVLDSDGFLKAQQDSLPRGGELPTDHWLTGEYITDSYVLPIPSDLTPGQYRIEIGMYSPDSGGRLNAADAAGAHLQDDRILLDDSITVKP